MSNKKSLVENDKRFAKSIYDPRFSLTPSNYSLNSVKKDPRFLLKKEEENKSLESRSFANQNIYITETTKLPEKRIQSLLHSSDCQTSYNNAPLIHQSTKRLAACNLDWDLLKSFEIYFFLNDFLPKDGKILKVCIYKSDIGKNKDSSGKDVLIEQPVSFLEKISFSQESNFNSTISENLQFTSNINSTSDNLFNENPDKCQYYYAIIETDSVKTADNIYSNVDGLEFGNTGILIDLRFVPDDICFIDCISTSSFDYKDYLTFKSSPHFLEEYSMSITNLSKSCNLSDTSRSFNYHQLFSQGQFEDSQALLDSSDDTSSIDESSYKSFSDHNFTSNIGSLKSILASESKYHSDIKSNKMDNDNIVISWDQPDLTTLERHIVKNRKKRITFSSTLKLRNLRKKKKRKDKRVKI